eukprot:TRINITY_DN12256_c0_g1_i1.p1 TRINITY_DN12256_c0_g1~~TRINITY_DN12256_c0_g1_i1.p1  ORF type:complete len:251 (+),score=37.64 TRINITY_DN12256_c0_g1_i1:20-772(+)
MEVWTASHITNVNRLNTLKLAIVSAKQTLLQLSDPFMHRLSISYNDVMEINVLEFIRTMSTQSCVFIDNGITQLTQFEHLQYIQYQAKQANINPNTMIIFLDDDDMLLDYPLICDLYDVVVGWQIVPYKYAMPKMRLLAEIKGYIGQGLELMLLIQEQADVAMINKMIEEKYMFTDVVTDFSGYSAKLSIINDVFDKVKDKERHGLVANMVDLDIMNALDEYKNKFSDQEKPFVYHRLMSSKDWIDIPTT